MQQFPPVFLLTGLSGAGKTTLAQHMVTRLQQSGKHALMLDGDHMRKSLCADLGFSLADRSESLRRVAHVAKLFAEQNFICFCSCIAPLQQQRNMFKEIIEHNYQEIFVKCPLEICQARDVKGLYAKVRHGLIAEYTGIASPYEEPEAPHLTVRTHVQSLEQSVEELYNYALKHM